MVASLPLVPLLKQVLNLLLSMYLQLVRGKLMLELVVVQEI
nr:MAG TPA: hypothetical protein [Caudoviricetes sp.]